MKLEEQFYELSTVEVAQKLIGKTLIYNNFKGIITETEAYRGEDDAASHAYKGPTSRSSIMFGPPAHVYVYMIYGIYYCLNIVTEKEGSAGAVLVRGIMLPDIHLNGPGKLCRHLNIDKKDHGINLLSSTNFNIINNELELNQFNATPRVGIKKATDKLWRFVMDNNLMVNKLKKL
jgi:DNA-3-methyladenine glycosylase